MLVDARESRVPESRCGCLSDRSSGLSYRLALAAPDLVESSDPSI